MTTGKPIICFSKIPLYRGSETLFRGKMNRVLISKMYIQDFLIVNYLYSEIRNFMIINNNRIEKEKESIGNVWRIL